MKTIKNEAGKFEIVTEFRNNILSFIGGLVLSILGLLLLREYGVIIAIFYLALAFTTVFQKELIYFDDKLNYSWKLIFLKKNLRIDLKDIKFIFFKERPEYFNGFNASLIIIETQRKKYKLGRGLSNIELMNMIMKLKDNCKIHGKTF